MGQAPAPKGVLSGSLFLTGASRREVIVPLTANFPPHSQGRTLTMKDYRIDLPHDAVPDKWYNIQPDLPRPLSHATGRETEG